MASRSGGAPSSGVRRTTRSTPGSSACPVGRSAERFPESTSENKGGLLAARHRRHGRAPTWRGWSARPLATSTRRACRTKVSQFATWLGETDLGFACGSERMTATSRRTGGSSGSTTGGGWRRQSLRRSASSWPSPDGEGRESLPLRLRSSCHRPCRPDATGSAFPLPSEMHCTRRASDATLRASDWGSDVFGRD